MVDQLMKRIKEQKGSRQNELALEQVNALLEKENKQKDKELEKMTEQISLQILKLEEI